MQGRSTSSVVDTGGGATFEARNRHDRTAVVAVAVPALGGSAVAGVDPRAGTSRTLINAPSPTLAAWEHRRRGEASLANGLNISPPS
jgi:hypothetical protein